jgi:hypothetical protein
MDFSQALDNKIDTIVKDWVEAVSQDGEIERAKELTYQAVRNSLPLVLQALVTMLSESEESDLRTLVEKSLDHGKLRAEQGYDAEEIAREYRLLRQVIFSSLEPDLLLGSPKEMLRAVRVIDIAIDEMIARCFKSYTLHRLRELQELSNQLSLTNQELSRMVRTHQDNLSHLAHELKNPLNSIIGYSNLLLRQQQRKNHEVKDSSVNLEHIERVLRNGQHLLRLINDVLEVSRHEAGKMKLRSEPTKVCSLIKDVIKVMEPSAGAKDLQLLVDCGNAPDRVLTDSLRLQQIVINLVSNAIRYTESGTVKVTCQVLADNQWSISVADTGVGIAPEDQDKIFEPYFRGRKRGSYSPDSTGLGLAIVSRLVQLLQGKIQLISQVGVGSTFTVIFPLEVKNTEEVVTG